MLTLLVYCNSFTVPFTLDDFGSIVNNQAIRNPLDIVSMWKFYSNRFITYITFSINFFIHDYGVEGYHVVNIGLHIFNGFLVFLILFYILGLKTFEGKLPGRFKNLISVMAALVFVCHPMQVNSVTYIVQRIASMAAMFYFLSILFFLKYRIYNKPRYFIFTLLFTVLGMFTKENTITIPFMLLVLELLFFLKEGSWKKRIGIFAIIFLTLPIIPFTDIFLGGYSQSDPSVSFKASTSMDRFQYFYTELNVIILYIKLLFVPDKQNFDYSNDFPVSHTIWENYSYISFAILALIGLTALLNLRRNKLLSLGIIWFFIGLSVESSFISIKDVYFEHRLYIPMAGFVIFIVGLIFGEIKIGFINYRFFKRPLLFFMVFLAFMIPMFSSLTLKRNFIYGSSVRLWSDVVEKAPMSDRAHASLGGAYLDRYDTSSDSHDLTEAEKELRKAIDLNYHNDTAHCNLSKVYLLQKNFEESILEANYSNSMNRSTYAYNNMGLAYMGLGKYSEAEDALLAGYNIDKKTTFILKSLGDVYLKAKDYKNAKFYYEQFLKNNKFADDQKVVLEKLKSIKDK